MNKKKKISLVIASTTSTQNSGLFDVLIPAYEKASRYGVSVEVIAVGSGKAIRMAKKGEADMLFLHEPFQEEKFVAEGYGVNRRHVMHNDFVIIGPKNDPALIRRRENPADVFEAIAERECPFVSRGDDSGTNIKEADLWDDAGISPAGKGWYFEVGAEMGDTLLIADRKQAYTICDRGTFLNYASRLSLRILVQGHAALKNQYSVIALNPAKFPAAQYREAMDFIGFVTSTEGQKVIGAYKKNGIRLFIPEFLPGPSSKTKRG